ncbi:MAG: tail fiber domain-containing protein, partial [Aeromonas veronii]
RYSTGNNGSGTDKINLDVSNGHIDVTGEIRGRNVNNFRLISGDYGVFGRINGGAYFILATASGDPVGTFSGLRPFAFNLSNGLVTLGNGATSTYLNTTDGGSGRGFSFNGKTAIGGSNDSWLRMNPSAQFADGIYCGTAGVLRHDGNIQRGGWGEQSSAVIRAASDVTWSANGSAAFSYLNTNTAAAHWLVASYIDANTIRSGIQVHSTDEGSIRFCTNRLANYVYMDAGNIVAQNNVTAFSDIRVKDNIKTIENALEKTLTLRGVTYDRTDQNNIRQTGLIAQEVEKVIPEAVITTPHDDYDDFKSVAYGNLVGLLVESIRELNNKIERLESLIKE